MKQFLEESGDPEHAHSFVLEDKIELRCRLELRGEDRIVEIGGNPR
jgi:hypothetical protein